MFFIIKNGLPYIVSSDEKTIYPCEISATHIKTDSKNPKDMPKDAVILSKTEILGKFGICLVDGWNQKTNQVVKVSNKTISSIKNDDLPNL
jgi:hypothetical protein